MGQYERLMDEVSEMKRTLFEQLINKVITLDEFSEECRLLEQMVEQRYFALMADQRLFMTFNEIWLDMGMIPNFS